MAKKPVTSGAGVSTTPRLDNEDGTLNGDAHNNRLVVRATEARQAGKPYSAVVRGREGNDHVVLTADEAINASLNGGSGNDLFYIEIHQGGRPSGMNTVRGPRGASSTVNVNGDAGTDTVRMWNPHDFSISHDGNGNVELTNLRSNTTVNLTGIERILYYPTSRVGPESSYNFELNSLLNNELKPNVSRNLESLFKEVAGRG